MVIFDCDGQVYDRNALVEIITKDMETDKKIYDRLHRCAKKVTGSYEKGEDIVMGVIEKIISGREGEFNVSNPVRYLLSMCRYAAISSNRKNAQLIRYVEKHKMRDNPIEEETPETIYQKKEAANIARGLLNELSPRSREIYEMWLEGKEYKEIGNVFNMNFLAVGNRITLANKKLKEKASRLEYLVA